MARHMASRSQRHMAREVAPLWYKKTSAILARDAAKAQQAGADARDSLPGHNDGRGRDALKDDPHEGISEKITK